jgi:hypothetical protein
MRNVILVLALAGTTTACAASGVTQQYQAARPDIGGNGQAITLGVLDHRPYVLDRNKPESFTGLSHSGSGGAFDVSTASGQPLATDMARALEEAFRAKGTKVTVVPLPPATTEREAMAKIATPGSKAVLITLAEWKSDTRWHTELHYDVRAVAVDGQGRSVGSNAMSGTDKLGGGFKARDKSPVLWFSHKMEQVFASPQMASAF